MTMTNNSAQKQEQAVLCRWMWNLSSSLPRRLLFSARPRIPSIMKSAILLSLVASSSTVLSFPLTVHQSRGNNNAAKSITLPFHRKYNPVSNNAGSRMRKRQAAVDDDSVLGNQYDTRYIASVVIAGQPLDLIVDTGSTDTFVYSVQPTGTEGIPESLLPPLFDNATAQGVIETGLTYEASYGGGNGITQTLGAIELADVSVNGTDLTAQNLTYANIYQSDSLTGASGLLGLGFPFNGAIYSTLLQAFYSSGRRLSAEQTQNFFPIVPLLDYQGSIQQSIFSIIIDRVTDAQLQNEGTNPFDIVFGNGSITFGDYPDGYTMSDFTYSLVPTVEIPSEYQALGLPPSTGNRWTLPLEAIYFNGRELSSTSQQPNITVDGGNYYALLDTGNPSMSMPSDVLRQIVPNGAYAANRAGATIPCDSQFDLEFQFGGKRFSLSREDTLVPSSEAVDSLGIGGYTTTECQAQIQPSEPSPDEVGPGTSITYQLGDPFLRNVVSTFSYGNILNSESQPPSIGLASRKA